MNIDELKQSFDLVKVKHFNTNTYKGTHVALVKKKEGKIYTGISRCHVRDQFSRKRGLEIALGRAFHAWKVDAGILPERSDLRNRQYSVAHTSEENLNKDLTNLVFTEPLQQLEPVEPEVGGCCGKCRD